MSDRKASRHRYRKGTHNHVPGGFDPHQPGLISEGGIRVPAVTADQMREIDRIAMEDTGPNLFQMMENAGRTLALQTIDALGSSWRSTRVVVLAGGGGNGGGGICAARHLANRDVAVALVLSEPDRLGEVPLFQRKVFASTCGREVDAAARSSLVDAGYPEPMHALGHQLGRSAHDGGTTLAPRWDRYGAAPLGLVEVGNVFTVEYGAAVPGHGYIGPEEDLVVTADGVEWLSTPQRELWLVG